MICAWRSYIRSLPALPCVAAPPSAKHLSWFLIPSLLKNVRVEYSSLPPTTHHTRTRVHTHTHTSIHIWIVGKHIAWVIIQRGCFSMRNVGRWKQTLHVLKTNPGLLFNGTWSLKTNPGSWFNGGLVFNLTPAHRGIRCRYDVENTLVLHHDVKTTYFRHRIDIVCPDVPAGIYIYILNIHNVFILWSNIKLCSLYRITYELIICSFP